MSVMLFFAQSFEFPSGQRKKEFWQDEITLPCLVGVLSLRNTAGRQRPRETISLSEASHITRAVDSGQS
jgi:hypothetical protein